MSRDEVPRFFGKIMETFGNIAQTFINYISGTASSVQETDRPYSAQSMENSQELQQNREIKEVECRLSEQEQVAYRQNLQEAKDICKANKDKLGLTDEELTFIYNADVVSEAYGAARFDRSSNKLLFNLNNLGDNSTGSLLKVLIHEVTHSTINSEHNSKSEERQCETRALTYASELFQQGKLNDFEVINGSNIFISQLDTDEKISQFVEMWLNMGYKDLPEQ